jgi:hypothetical protein
MNGKVAQVLANRDSHRVATMASIELLISIRQRMPSSMSLIF